MAEQKRKLSLVRAFAKAVLGLVAVVTLGYGAWFGAFYAGKGEKLTQGEKQAVKQIFGDQVNAGKIRKHFKDEGHITHVFGWASGTVLPPFSHIDFFGDWPRVKDFSQAGRSRYGFFLHEVTHAWQGQNLKFSAKNIGRYEYQSMLTPKSRFRDFGTEQQAEIVEAYAGKWIHPEGARMKKDRADSLVARVIENQFPQARVTRDSLERLRADTLPPSGPRKA